MKSKAELIRLLWRVLVVAVVVYVVAGFITLFLDGTQPFPGSSGAWWRQLVFDAQFMAFRVGAGALALMAGMWLSTRPWDEQTPGPSSGA